MVFGSEQAAAVGGDGFPTLRRGIIKSNFAPKVGPLACGGESIHGDILARRGFTVNVQKSRMADGGVLVERIGGISGAAEICRRRIATRLCAEPVADGIVLIAEITSCEGFPS